MPVCLSKKAGSTQWYEDGIAYARVRYPLVTALELMLPLFPKRTLTNIQLMRSYCLHL